MLPPDQLLQGSYAYYLVALSVLISVFASYAALDLAGRVAAARGIARSVWLGGGALAMGIGIWAMHYVGMLALRLPVPVKYDWPTVLLSLLAAICASGIALFVTSRTRMGRGRALLGSIFMGGAIAGMHYIGMAAMRMPAMCHYSSDLVMFSILLAIVISFVALWLTFRLRNETKPGDWRKVLSAVVMGVAVPIMHYTGMAAASFTSSPGDSGDLSRAISISSFGTLEIVLITFIILGIAILTSLVDRSFSAQTSELRASEQRSRQILETSFDTFVGMDQRGRITDWNEQAEVMLGWTKTEVAGKTLMETIIPPEHREECDALRTQMISSVHSARQKKRFEMSVICRDGRVVPVEMTISVIPKDNSYYFAGFLRDLSDQKRAEESLQASLKELNDLQFALNQHCIVARTDHRGIISFVNDKFCSISHYPREELIGQDHRIVNSKYHPKEFIAGLWTTIQDGQVWKGEIKNRAKNGTEYWVDTTIAPIQDTQGRIQQYIAIRTDITPLKQAEKESRAAKEAAEAASRAKSDFLANMSHEIRTPMNGIIGISNLLAQTKLDAEQRNYLDLVTTSAQSLLTVLNDILDFSKIESGKLDFSPTPVALRRSLLNILKVFAAQASKKHLELTLLVSDDVPETVMADELRVRQVLNNLIGNSLKFTSSGEIAVRVDHEKSCESKVNLHFQVRDTGVGIPPDKLKLIFEPFSQADSSITRKYGGTGLGLTISVRLVQMMGGRIWVESEPGQGSTFHFITSFDPAPLTVLSDAPRDSAFLRETNALVVDDNATNRLILEKTLDRWGVRTRSAASAAEGLTELSVANDQGEPFSLLIVDGQMPEMDGFSMVRRLRERSDFDRLAIVMLTSAGVLGDGERCRELGIRGFLSKPVDPETLHDSILRALGQFSDQLVSVTANPSLPSEPIASVRILLAEDNPINQVVATRHLEKLGHAVKVASNGRQAIDLWEKDSFDVILMDVQMPEMSGYEATSEIRIREASTHRHIPIIAMTAHAMVGDREKCLAAGMDGYVSKPIQIDTLSAEISTVLSGVTLAPVVASPPAILEVLNRAQLVTLMDSDLDLLATSVEISKTEFPRLLAELHAAVDSRNAVQMEQAAHAMKGMLRGLAGESCAALAQRLETMGKSAEMDDGSSLLSTLEAEMNRFDRELAHFLEDAKAANSLGSLLRTT